MFSDLSIKRFYRIKKDNVAEQFFNPVLKEAKTYYRGTGFFSIEALQDLSEGLIPYIKNGGVIRIITSVRLDEDELVVLSKGHDIAERTIKEYLLNDIDKAINKVDPTLDLDLIANLIAADKLIIKIAYLADGGLYHEKIGYFEDNHENSIFFIGSNNETVNGLNRNADSFAVLKSWEGDKVDIEEQKNYILSLWDNKDNEIRVFDFPDAAKEKLFSKYKTSVTVDDVITLIESKYSRPDKNEKGLYWYQDTAIKEFVQNRYCHFFEMATGTGKTFTAVKAVQQLFEDMNGKSLYTIVVVPQIELQTQWQKEFNKQGIECLLFGGNSTSKDWENDLFTSFIEYQNDVKLIVAISTYDTYFAKVQQAIDNKKMNKLIIVDEAHELSQNQISKLSENYRFRLGLSATPQRHSVSETNAIVNYFTRGSVDTYKYDIEDAIKGCYLSRYYYYPIVVHMEDSEIEFQKYQSYTKRLVQLYNEEDPDRDKIQEVLNNRSLIVKKCANKIDKLCEMISGNKYDFHNAVIYCGQGKDVETEESIIDNVTKALNDIGKYRVSQFTSKTTDRAEVLKEFEAGNYDTLVAIKCFDQGVDVPKLDKIYIMASDSLQRQTIQRRGRVLRVCKDSGKTYAYIYDMVTLPPEGKESDFGASSLVAKELIRVREYGRLAENKDDIDGFIARLEELYSVEDNSYDEKESID